MPPSDPIIEELLAALRSDKTIEEEKMTLNYSGIWLLSRWESSHQRINYSFSMKCLSSIQSFSGARTSLRRQTRITIWVVSTCHTSRQHQPHRMAMPLKHVDPTPLNHSYHRTRGWCSNACHPLLHQWCLMVLNILRLVDSDYPEHYHDICSFYLWS